MGYAAIMRSLREAVQILEERMVDELNELAAEHGIDGTFDDVPDLDNARSLILDVIAALEVPHGRD